MISKFPVISQSGQEYRVSIKEGFIKDDYLVTIEVKTETTGWFNRTKVKWNIVREQFVESKNHEFIGIATSQVMKHEQEIQAALDRRDKIIEQKKKFSNWDGKI